MLQVTSQNFTKMMWTVLHGGLTCATGCTREADSVTEAVGQQACSCQHLDYPPAADVHQVRNPAAATPVQTHAVNNYHNMLNACTFFNYSTIGLKNSLLLLYT